jgi:hypothetical protein
MIKTQKEKIKSVLAQNFKKSDQSQFYFVKGVNDFSNSIIIKTKEVFEQKKLDELKFLLRNELQNSTLEIFEWLNIVGGFIPKKSIYKIPFFDTNEIKEYNPWRVCPVGEHWVRRHDRQKEHLEDVDGHCRKNPSGKDLIKGDEIDLIARSDRFLNLTIIVSKGLKKFPNHDLYDDLISGWTVYWNDIFKIEPPLHPNYVKALIATESSFIPQKINPNNPKKIGPARGLTQITEQTQKSLSGEIKDVKDHFVILSDEEILDPNKNICAAVRWLFRKRDTAKARIKREPTWEEVLMEYKGRLKSKKKDTQEIRKKLNEFLGKLNE